MNGPRWFLENLHMPYHHKAQEGWETNIVLDIPLTNIKLVPACIHRDLVLGNGILGIGHSTSADNVTSCQKECQKEDFCEVFMYTE